SSDAWNNAGTGHSAFCELNYTPERDGVVDVTKAIRIASSFEVSRQLWASLVERGVLPDPSAFVRPIPHCSFTAGEADAAFLRRRYETMQRSPLFAGMDWSTDPAVLASWMPLMMAGRDPSTPVAATSMRLGTDVNFGALTRGLFAHLGAQGADLRFFQEVSAIERCDGGWCVSTEDPDTGEQGEVRARFVFIGAGGGALPLLLKSGIREGRSYGGFPVSGQWLVCRDPDTIARHHAKVYGKAAVGAPPMSVPHLDTRFIDGQQALLFGPYAGFSTRFLKHGSLLDLPLSVRARNVLPMLAAGFDNLALTRYLVEQVVQSHEDRMATLRAFVPTARDEDWELLVAGQRVQVIKKDDEQGGVLEFGTEVVASSDGTLAALLGASPGASTAASIQLSVLERCFPERWASAGWQERIRQLVPCHGQDLHADAEALRVARARSTALLGA
ncbi:MAG: malate dehydrogenase (quinone), partial [Myxococcales bacterium]|nr:malate dehydrogenase (quinone) [Myxococcales bacterium]